MSNFDYTTIDEQIQKLKFQKLTIENINDAKEVLKTYGYYSIINGYRDPYIIRSFNVKTYSPDVTFDQIFWLFLLDHDIRDIVLLAMIELEEHLKAIVAEIISADFGTDYNVYLSNNNYRDKQVNNPKFRRNNILAGMRKTAEISDFQPIKYYRETHNTIPPWILLKGVYFGTLVNYIKFFKAPQREKLVHALYGSKVNSQNMEYYKDLLADTLALCLEYRNLAAHGGRVYNYIPNSQIRAFASDNAVRPGLPQFVSALQILEFTRPYDRITQTIEQCTSQYCSQFPNDLHRLEQAIGFRIDTKEVVWVHPKSNIAHSTPNCSGATNLAKVELTDENRGIFRYCKRCCK